MDQRITDGHRCHFQSISRVRQLLLYCLHRIGDGRGIIQFNRQILRARKTTKNTIQFYGDLHGSAT